jgi:hypothetical protein
MKKTITQLTMMVAFVLMGSMASAQLCSGSVTIKNGSQDTWTVSYYGVQSPPIAPNTQFNLGFNNADGTQGRGVILGPSVTTVTSFCGHKFQFNPEIWNAPCAPGTASVTYSGTQDPATGCYTSALIYIQ